MSNDNMTLAEQLAELKVQLQIGVGDYIRWENDVLEAYGDTATKEQEIDAAKKVLGSLNHGCMGLMRESSRRKKLQKRFPYLNSR